MILVLLFVPSFLTKLKVQFVVVSTVKQNLYQNTKLTGSHRFY